MRWARRQSKIEQAVDDCIDDIAEEIGLKVPYYPEVWWVGRKVQFEDLQISQEYLDGFIDIVKQGGSIFNCKYQSILIGKPSIIHAAEEGAHFLHVVNSNLKVTKGLEIDFMSTRIIMETLGYFGSKLIFPERCSLFKEPEPVTKDKIIKKMTEMGRDLNNLDTLDFAYEQAHHLGEKLFNYYISGEISKRKVRKFFKDPMDKPFDPFFKFIQLKYETLV